MRADHRTFLLIVSAMLAALAAPGGAQALRPYPFYDPDLPIDVTVTLRNQGTVTADEVVQLYVTHDTAGGPKPLRALKGFTRVSLKAGEARQVTFSLSERDLSLVTADGRPWPRRAATRRGAHRRPEDASPLIKK